MKLLSALMMVAAMLVGCSGEAPSPSPTSTAMSCRQLGWVCGFDDHAMSCGSCSTGSTCSSGTCSATPAPTCASLGWECGATPGGRDCGSCPTGQMCSSGTCSATPIPTCASLGWVCGTTDSGRVCGSCPTGQMCSSGRCVATPVPTCVSLGWECGDGGGLSCGGCPSGRTCSEHRCRPSYEIVSRTFDLTITRSTAIVFALPADTTVNFVTSSSSVVDEYDFAIFGLSQWNAYGRFDDWALAMVPVYRVTRSSGSIRLPAGDYTFSFRCRNRLFDCHITLRALGAP